MHYVYHMFHCDVAQIICEVTGFHLGVDMNHLQDCQGFSTTYRPVMAINRMHLFTIDA